jgi:PAS domain S-box-containing protein
MSSYVYSGYLWPSIVSTVLVAALAWYGWRHRAMPAALPFAVACLFAVAWSIGSMLETAAVDPDTKIFWLKFVTLWQLPLVTAATCFLLQYVGLGRLLTRRVVILLAVPPLLSAALILTSGLHDLAWTHLTFVDGSIEPVLGTGLTAALTYSYLLAIINLALLLWLFVRSPRHRWPVTLLVLGQLAARFFFEFGVLHWRLPPQWDPDPFVLVAVFGLYAVVLFRFHALDPVPLARATAVEQMREGMLVVDVGGQIVDANPSAQRALGRSLASLSGRAAYEVLPLSNHPAGGENRDAASEAEFDVGCGAEARHYLLEETPLKDRRGSELGRLLLLHDVTEQKRAQARLVERERAVATLQERERLARELHDGVGQVLGYLSLQAQTARKRLKDGDNEKADALLARLADVAQHAHVDVRESILALKAASSEDWSFLPTLDRYLRDFQAQYGIRTELSVADGVSEESFEPNASAQLLRVIQEALTNARRHGAAGTVCVAVGQNGDQTCITVTDDGCGFDLQRSGPDSSRHFGLVFMRERMAQIEGSVTIESGQDAGTSVKLKVPLHGDGKVKG